MLVCMHIPDGNYMNSAEKLFVCCFFDVRRQQPAS